MSNKFSIPYRDSAITRDDIDQEALLALWKACLTFDENSGAKFATYAAIVMRNEISMMMVRSNPIKIPRVWKEINATVYSHGFEFPLSEEEISVIVSEGKFTRKQIENYQEPIPLYLDAEIKESDNTATIADIIPDLSSEIIDRFSEDDLEGIINTILGFVKSKHKDLIEEWIYSLLCGESITQRDLAKKYNLTQSYASRVLASAVRTLQEHKEEIYELLCL